MYKMHNEDRATEEKVKENNREDVSNKEKQEAPLGSYVPYNFASFLMDPSG